MTSVATPSNDTVVIASGSTTVTYTPNTNISGVDRFCYTLSEGTATDWGTPARQKPLALD